MPLSKNNRFSPQAFWLIFLGLSLLANAHFVFQKPSAGKTVLASVNGQAFRWNDLSDKGKKALASLDQQYYHKLLEEAELWAENQVLPREAQERGLRVEDLLEQEVLSKAGVAPREVYAIYAQSPAANAMPYDQALAAIENHLYAPRYRKAKAAFLSRLFEKYRVRFTVPKPKGEVPPEPTILTDPFPAYQPSPVPAEIPSIGPVSAPVVIEVYGDFMCPYSKRFSASLKEAEAAYPEKLRVLFRNFPLPIHPGAAFMHEAALCAGEQGKFWEFHDSLMALPAGKQEKEALSAAAGTLGLDSKAFESCLDSGRHADRVQADVAEGKKAGVRGTPAYFINGRRGTGAISPEALKAILAWHLNPQGAYPSAASAKSAGPAKVPSQPTA